MTSQAVYKLEPIVDNPRFEGFACTTPGSFPESIPRSRTTRTWRPASLVATWRPLKVKGCVKPYNDYPCVALSHPAFSARAIQILRDMLEANGELLPLSTENGTYYAFNLMTVADVLNWQRSEMTWFRKPVIADEIEYYEFFSEKLKGRTIFRLPELASHIYVTEQFASRVETAELQGFWFVKVWPLPPGVMWWKLDKERRSKGG